MAGPASAPSTPAAQAAAARLAGMKPPPRPPAAPDAAAEPARAKDKRAGKKDGADGDKKKRKLPVKAIAGVVILLLVGFVAKGKIMKPHYRPGEPVPAGEVMSLGQITTNLSDGHLAQVSVSLQLTKPANPKEIAKDEPELVATIVTDLGQQTYTGLLPPTGRAALRQQLLAGFQHTLGTSEGAEQVSAVYFTSFVLQ